MKGFLFILLMVAFACIADLTTRVQTLERADKISDELPAKVDRLEEQLKQCYCIKTMEE
jgi:hypothetical protein